VIREYARGFFQVCEISHIFTKFYKLVLALKCVYSSGYLCCAESSEDAVTI
jgi:hypothetical protein